MTRGAYKYYNQLLVPHVLFYTYLQNSVDNIVVISITMPLTSSSNFKNILFLFYFSVENNVSKSLKIKIGVIRMFYNYYAVHNLFLIKKKVFI